MTQREGYTAGAWQVVKLDGDTYIQKGDGSRKNSGNGLLARVQGQGDTQIANARLIASAPELLERLKDILDANGKMIDLEAVRAAIAKAERGA